MKAKVTSDLPIIRGVMNLAIGTKYYDELREKPMINGVEIVGNKKGKDYGLIDDLDEITNTDIEAMFNEAFKTKLNL